VNGRRPKFFDVEVIASSAKFEYKRWMSKALTRDSGTNVRSSPNRDVEMRGVAETAAEVESGGRGKISQSNNLICLRSRNILRKVVPRPRLVLRLGQSLLHDQQT
jgi:hypothetical protein